MPIGYRDAGVDIDAGEELVRRIAPLAARTRIPGVVSDLGGFAGMFAVPSGMREPLLVSGTDGVGTKLKLAFALGVHDTVGIDLVAMCVNDIITCGARPLFFLDYFSVGKLSVDVGEAVVRGVARGCELAGCALLGGETAEMPGMYGDGEYDLAGFAVGVVERSELRGPARVRDGDAIIAVGSSGLHSNGYSLARRVIAEMNLDFDARPEGIAGTVGEVLLEPTRIYARAVAALLETLGDEAHAFAHITGGGLTDNVPRVLPDGMSAHIDLDYPRPPIFQLLQRGGPVEEREMRRTFNLGVGLVAIVDSAASERAVACFQAAGEHAWRIGTVRSASDGQVVFTGGQ